ncbi:hypothetical protein BY996DRAFT_6573615 [Phakopsora pachyrhizi]|nr:hypothetical protein BY996DRAFT_6573615 [Phakopsora pachyrhizi]
MDAAWQGREAWAWHGMARLGLEQGRDAGRDAAWGLAWLVWVWSKVGKPGAWLGLAGLGLGQAGSGAGREAWGLVWIGAGLLAGQGLAGLQGGLFWTDWARERLGRAVAGHLSVRKKKGGEEKGLTQYPSFEINSKCDLLTIPFENFFPGAGQAGMYDH